MSISVKIDISKRERRGHIGILREQIPMVIDSMKIPGIKIITKDEGITEEPNLCYRPSINKCSSNFVCWFV